MHLCGPEWVARRQQPFHSDAALMQAAGRTLLAYFCLTCKSCAWHLWLVSCCNTGTPQVTLLMPGASQGKNRALASLPPLSSFTMLGKPPAVATLS